MYFSDWPLSVTFARLLAASMAAEPFTHLFFQMVVELEPDINHELGN